MDFNESIRIKNDNLTIKWRIRTWTKISILQKQKLNYREREVNVVQGETETFRLKFNLSGT